MSFSSPPVALVLAGSLAAALAPLVPGPGAHVAAVVVVGIVAGALPGLVALAAPFEARPARVVLGGIGAGLLVGDVGLLVDPESSFRPELLIADGSGQAPALAAVLLTMFGHLAWVAAAVWPGAETERAGADVSRPTASFGAAVGGVAAAVSATVALESVSALAIISDLRGPGIWAIASTVAVALVAFGSGLVAARRRGLAAAGLVGMAALAGPAAVHLAAALSDGVHGASAALSGAALALTAAAALCLALGDARPRPAVVAGIVGVAAGLSGVAAGTAGLVVVVDDVFGLPYDEPAVRGQGGLVLVGAGLAVVSATLFVPRLAGAVRPVLGVAWLALPLAASYPLARTFEVVELPSGIDALTRLGVYFPEFGPSAGAWWFAPVLAAAVVLGLTLAAAGAAERAALSDVEADALDRAEEGVRTQQVVAACVGLLAAAALLLPTFTGGPAELAGAAVSTPWVGARPFTVDALLRTATAVGVLIAAAVAARSRPARAAGLAGGVALLLCSVLATAPDQFSGAPGAGWAIGAWLAAAGVVTAVAAGAVAARHGTGR